MRFNKKGYFNMPLKAALCLVLLSAAGCMMAGKDYVRPETAVSDSWNTGMAGGLRPDEPDRRELVSWWETLHDPVLTGLIGRAVESNLDLRAAGLRLRQARAQRSIAGSDLFPSLDASGSVVRSGNGVDNLSRSNRTAYLAGFDAGWEIDLFGGIRRSVEASEADLQAAGENIHDVMVSLTAEVALNYLELATYRARLRVSEQNLKMQEETYQLEQYRLVAGLSDELAIAQARSNLENTRSRLPALRTQAEQAKNRLAVLLGRQPGSLGEALDGDLPVPDVPAEVAVGVPADVLRRRPDIRRAERELAAQTARVGVARSDLYPKLALNGSIGFESLSSGDLLSGRSRSWSWGPRIAWPIFRGNAIRANIEVQSALQEQALVQYESAVLTALREVEDAMVAFAEEQTRKASLKEAAAAARQALDFAQNKYDAGMIEFITVLDAQRTLLSYQDELVQSEAAVTTNLVRLYKALGGGWTPMGPETGTELLEGETS